MSVCAVESCSGEAKARGWCKRHWQHWRRNGQPEPVTTEDRFFASVRRAGASECWPWAGTIGAKGYGVFKVDRVARGAHVVAYEKEHGLVPAGMQVGHACHDRDVSCLGGVCLHRRCCNPGHLEAMTPQVNLLSGRTRAAENAAKTHCPAGHAYDDENTYRDKSGRRACRSCARRRKREDPEALDVPGVRIAVWRIAEAAQPTLGDMP